MHFDYRPDRLEINAEIMMDQHIPHAGDLLPRYPGMRLSETLGHILCRLADDFEIADDGVLGSTI